MRDRIVRQYCFPCKKIIVSGAADHVGHRVKNAPSNKTLEHYVYDGVVKSPDGCRIEPDGICQHGHASWLMIIGII